MKSINLPDDITTWGNLKELLAENNIETEGMNAVVRQTKVTLQSDGAELPSEDVYPEGFTVFLFTEKVKSGVFDKDRFFKEMKEEFEEVFDKFQENFEDGDYDIDEDDDELEERARLEKELRG